MSWWMIVLIVLAAFVAIGLIPVGIDAGYLEDAYFVKLKIWLLRITLLPQREKKQKPKRQKKAKAPKMQEETPPEEGDEKKKFSIPGGVDGIGSIVRFACDVLGDMRRKLRVEKLYLHIAFGGEGEKAARNYAMSWAAIGALNPMLDRIFVIRERDIRPELRVGQEKLALDVRLILTITIGRALALGLRAGVKILKLMNELKKGGATNEPSSV